MPDFRVDNDEMLTYYVEETKIAYVVYRRVLTPAITARMYEWGFKVQSTVGTENVRGAIFDFRAVEEFHKDNFQAVRKENRNFTQVLDVSRLPAALVVKNLFQEQMITVSSKITGQEHRTRIVHSIESALAFIEEYHQEKPCP